MVNITKLLLKALVHNLNMRDVLCLLWDQAEAQEDPVVPMHSPKGGEHGTDGEQQAWRILERPCAYRICAQHNK